MQFEGCAMQLISAQSGGIKLAFFANMYLP